MNQSYEFVRYALEIGALELLPEKRKLKSGRMSPYFFNSGLFFRARFLEKLAEAYVSAFRGPILSHTIKMPEVIFGPAYKGVPLAVAVALKFSATYMPAKDVGYAFNRKEAKGHGEGGLLIGAPLKGAQVLIVDDVMTSGTSSAEAMGLIIENGGTPVGCVIAFDRMERGLGENGLSATQEFTERYGIPVFVAATLNDLVFVLGENPEIPGAKETLPLILEYRQEFGVKAK